MQFHKSPISSGLQDVSQILASSRRAQWGPTIRIRLKNSDFWWKEERRWCGGGGRPFRTFGLEGVALKSWRIMWYSPIWESRFIPIWYRPPIVGKTRLAASFRLDFYAENFITCSYFGPWMLRQMRKALAYLKEITNFHFIWCLASPGLEKFPSKMNPA